MRKLLVTLATALGVTAGLVGVAPAHATRVMPGRFTGYAFDACHTPTSAQMDVWRKTSPYAGVAVYIAGANRYCDDQPNLTRAWVSHQSSLGWRILPLTVGRQASCWKPHKSTVTHIDPDSTDSYAAARGQGRAEATSTIRAARALGLPKGTTQWLDIEGFDISKNNCRRSMLSFVSGWTGRLHELGYKSGFYSSAASGIEALENARTLSPGSYHLPDQVWFAQWDGRAATSTAYLPASAWTGQRVHQYKGGHDERHGGVTINVDSNWMEVGGGTRPPAKAGHCGVQVDFPAYGTLRRGSSGPKVSALQCLLRQRHVYGGKVTGHYKTATAHAVRRFQHRRGLTVTGVANKHTWVSLLSTGDAPLLKVGYASNAVRRVQRAMNAAGPNRLEISGVYDRPTAAAVKRYERARSLPATGVVTWPVWQQLFAGHR